MTLSHLDSLEDDTHLEAESDDDAESSFDVSPVHAWLQAVSVSSREDEPEERSSQPVSARPHASTLHTSSAPCSTDPLTRVFSSSLQQENVQEASDFWAIHSELRFDEEPEPSPVSSSGLSLPELDLDSVDSVSTFEADDVSPWDSVSARDESRSLSGHEYYEYEEADVEEDEQQRDDSSTLYSEAEDDEMARVLQRHAFLTGKPVDLALHRMSSPWADRTPSSPLGFNAARLFAEQPAVLAGF